MSRAGSVRTRWIDGGRIRRSIFGEDGCQCDSGEPLDPIGKELSSVYHRHLQRCGDQVTAGYGPDIARSEGNPFEALTTSDLEYTAQWQGSNDILCRELSTLRTNSIPNLPGSRILRATRVADEETHGDRN